MYKQWLGFLVIVFMLWGCTPSQKKDESTSASSRQSQQQAKIALIQLSQNPSFTDMKEGFIAGMSELGYTEEDVEYVHYDAGGNIATLHTILDSVEGKDFDLLITLVTSVTQAAVSKELSTPIIFISVTDPVEAGIMASLQTPDRNATGTCNIVPMEALFQLAKELTPDIRSVGILYDPSLPNSVITVNRAKEYLGKAGFVVAECAVTNSSEVQSATQTLVDLTDSIYLPIDSTILSAIPQVIDIALQAKKPVYGSAPSMVTSGALASVSVSEWETGRQTAQLADKYLQGTPINQIPAHVVDSFVHMVNQETAKALGLSLNESLVETVELVNTGGAQ